MKWKKKTKEEIKTAETVKTYKFKSHLGQQPKNIANLADVNKNMVI